LKACITVFGGTLSTRQKSLKLKVLVPNPENDAFPSVWAYVQPDRFEEVMNGIPVDKRVIGIFA
jgi:hypothetical protein